MDMGPCQQCFGKGVREESGTLHRTVSAGGYQQEPTGCNIAFGDNSQKIPVPPLSTPVESYLDKSFLDQTSPRLKQDVPLPGKGPAPVLRPLVPAEGAVILEVLTRHKVIGPKGRDFDATVQVVVPSTPSPGQLFDKTVTQLVVPGAQAGALAGMLADTIAAMAFENKLMVPEGTQTAQGYTGVGSFGHRVVWPTDEFGDLQGHVDPLHQAGLGAFNDFFAAVPGYSFLEEVGSTFLQEGIALGMAAARTGDYGAIIEKAKEIIEKCPNEEKKKILLEMFALFEKNKETLMKATPKTSEAPLQEGTPSAVFPDDMDLPIPSADQKTPCVHSPDSIESDKGVLCVHCKAVINYSVVEHRWMEV